MKGHVHLRVWRRQLTRRQQQKWKKVDNDPTSMKTLYGESMWSKEYDSFSPMPMAFSRPSPVLLEISYILAIAWFVLV